MTLEQSGLYRQIDLVPTKNGRGYEEGRRKGCRENGKDREMREGEEP